MSDLINRPDAIEALLIGCEMLRRVLDDLSIVGQDREKFSWGLGLIESFIDDINELPSAEPEIIRCKDCKYWNEGNCNCPDIRVDCPDYYVGDIVTEEDFYCGFAKRREE